MNYLIPANTKKGELILGIFRGFDLILFGVGILLTLTLLVSMPMNDTMPVSYTHLTLPTKRIV